MSSWAAGEARAKTGCNVFEGSIEESALAEGAYDAVTMLDLIEHVPDPMSTVASAARLLRPGGALFVLTPDLGAPVARLMRSWWWGLRPAHLHYFSRATLTDFLEKSGFAVVEVRRPGHWFTLGYWISRLTGYSPGLAALAGKLAKMVLIEHLPVYLNTLDSVGVLAIKKESLMKEGKKIVAVLPAYNAEKTLERTLADIPKGLFDELILVDDASKDGTVELARRLGGLTVVVHEKNRGYGGNQKTCYKTALSMGADVVVMIHPDYQYDPTLAPEMVAPILQGKADCVLGSRMMRDTALKGKMPVWKYVGNKFLTGLENLGFGARFSEYHTGYRAYTKKVLSSLQLELNSDGFVFDQEIIAQMLAAGYRIVEVPIPTRYFKEASSVGFWVSVKYGLLTLWLLARYRARRWFRLPIRQFQLLE
jgi:SAM-dependent methyltransferase